MFVVSLQESEKAQKSLFTWQSNYFIFNKWTFVNLFAFPHLQQSYLPVNAACNTTIMFSQDHIKSMAVSFQLLFPQKTVSGRYTEQNQDLNPQQYIILILIGKVSFLPQPWVSPCTVSEYCMLTPSTVLQTCQEYFKGQAGKRQHNLHLVLILTRFSTWF